MNYISLDYLLLNRIYIWLVSVHCKDTRIAVEVKTTEPFNGRLYSLGRSETCNVAIVDSTKFRLDLTMAGQDCNTQSVVSFSQLYALLQTFVFLHIPISSSPIEYYYTMLKQSPLDMFQNGVYTNTVVIQHHSVVMTKTDKIYKIRCTYDMSAKNITFGMMPIRYGVLNICSKIVFQSITNR